MPASLATEPDPALAFLELVDDPEVCTATGEAWDRVAVSLACHTSIRKGKALTHEEMRELVTQLEACASPRTCAHGRPTIVHFSTAMLESEFLRR